MVKFNKLINDIVEGFHSSELLSIIFDMNPDAIALTRLSDGELIYCNPAYLNQIGYSREEVIGFKSQELNLYVNSDDRQAYVNEILEKKSINNFELRIKRKDYNIIDVLYSARLITLDDEQIIINIGHDITERKKAGEREQELLESERQLTEELLTSNKELKVSNEELQDTTEELRVSNEELQQQGDELVQLNKILQESEEKYRTLFDTMVQGVVYQDKNGEIISVNHSAEEILGLTIDQMAGKTSNDPNWKSIHEDGTEFKVETHPAMVALKTGKKVKNVIMGVFDPKKKETRWININATPQYKNDEKTPYQVYTTFEDITALKNSEYVLMESEAKYRSIIETANEGIMITDPSANVKFVNAKMAEMLGYSIGELVGIDSFCLIDKTELKNAKQRVEDRKKGIRGEYELKFHTKNGENLWAHGSVSPIYDHEGVHTGNLTMYSDITKRKKAEKINQELLEKEQLLTEELQTLNEELQSTTKEIQESYEKLNESLEELRKSESLLSSITNSSSDIIYIKDRQSRWIFANPALEQFIGRNVDELLGKNDLEIYSDPEIGKTILENDSKIMDSGKEEILEEVVEAPDGMRSFISVKTPRFNGEGQVIGLVGISHDITERKKAEEALYKSQTELNRAQKIAHIGSWTWDIIVDEVTWSDEFYRIYGLAPGEVEPSYELFLSFIVSEDKERVDKEVKEAIDIGKKYNITYNIIRQDGIPRIVTSENDFITDDLGKVVKIYGTNQDVTELKIAEKREQELLENERQLTEELLTSNEELKVSNEELQDTTEELRVSNEELQSTTEELRASNEELQQQGNELMAVNNALRESEERLHLAQIRGNVGVWDWNTVTNELNFTPELERLYGLNPGTINTYQDWRQLTHPDDVIKIEAERDDNIANHEQFDLEFRIFHDSGDIRWLSAKGGAIYNNEGNVVRVLGINTDITERKQAEIQIEYQAYLLGQVNDAVFGLDNNFTITYWNKGAEKMYGYTQVEALGNNSFELLRPKYPPGERERVIEELENRGISISTISTKDKNGTDIIVEQNSTRITDMSDFTSGYVVIYRDITKRKKAEEDLQNAIDRFDHVLNKLTDFFAIADPKWRYLYVNDAYTQFVGKNRKQLIGNIVWDIIPGAKGTLNYENCIKTAEDKITRTWNSYSPFTDHWMEYRTFAWDEGVAILARDITDNKKAEEDLNQSQKLLQDVINGYPSPIFVKDFEGRFLTINNKLEELLGVKNEEIKGKTDYDIITKELAENYRANDQKVLEEGKLIQIEEEADLTDGHHTFINHKFPIYDINGKTYGVGSISTDITERKLLEEKLQKSTEELSKFNIELKRSNEELERFAYVSSHDLQEPIRMVTSFTQLLARRYKGQLDSEADEYMEFIVEGAHRMKYLIDDLLTFSRVTSQTKEYEEVNLETVLNNVLSDLSVSIEGSNAIITHDPLPTIIADKTQKMQVFQNLIANAIKFQGSNPPKIHISAHKDEKEWKFSVADNGIGIAPEYQKQIFEVFKRLHTRDVYPGSGIGLSVCQKIIRRHGGDIWVESELGKGSTFYFTIPFRVK